MAVYIFSTMSAPVDYNVYKTADNGASFLQKTIHIKGGANVVDTKVLHTPLGVCTSVSDEDYEILQTIPVFNIHLRNGFIKVLKKNPADIEKAAADLEAKDLSAPLNSKSTDSEESDSNGVKTVKISAKGKKR